MTAPKGSGFFISATKIVKKTDSLTFSSQRGGGKSFASGQGWGSQVLDFFLPGREDLEPGETASVTVPERETVAKFIGKVVPHQYEVKID